MGDYEKYIGKKMMIQKKTAMLTSGKLLIMTMVLMMTQKKRF